MKIQFYRDKTEFYTRGLLAVTVLLGALILLQIAGFFVASSEARVMAARVDPNGAQPNKFGCGTPTPQDMNKLLASTRACAEELKKKNLFVLPAPKQHPVSDVFGILGDEALINGQWYKVGQSVGDAKILAIEPTKVRVAWDGQEKEFLPIGARSAGGPADRSGPPRSGGGPSSPGKAQVVVAGRRGGPSAGALSSEEMNRMRERFQGMTPDERQRAREEFRQKPGTKPR